MKEAMKHELCFCAGVLFSALFAALLYRYAKRFCGVIILAAAVQIHAGDFLATLAQVESGNRPSAIGRAGERGLYQMSEAAWWDVRSSGRVKAYPFSAATNPAVSRIYAREYLRLLRKDFTAATGRTPTSVELYACWNLGLHGFRRCGFSLSKCPKTTQRAAAQFK